MSKTFGDLQIGDRIYVVTPYGLYEHNIYELYTMSMFLGFKNIRNEQDVLVLRSPNWMDSQLVIPGGEMIIFTDYEQAKAYSHRFEDLTR